MRNRTLRSPSFDGLHAADNAEDVVLRGPDNNDWQITNGKWTIFEMAKYEIVESKVGNNVELDLVELPRVRKVEMRINTNSIITRDVQSGEYKKEYEEYKYQPEPKRKPGRPQTVNHGTRQPTLYNKFVKETIGTLQFGLSPRERMQECARLWRALKNNKI